ncbi:Thioredoxin-like [Nonlabens sp. Hel1_33_55]|uniref:TlpA family protein disulfide reductase n=1 Tax=Nonlabens sp. Hel1_33_55 TaxID=1336802 RepID=UPI000875C34A|nr:thioredoxin-like domain-containing protein [Nonlabens sp. Hel1_33_55]SCY27518.1 Thioredoxin-like [Nonlabens sp. Hel1_33_55]
MNRILILACLILIVGCKKDQEPIEENLLDLNLYLTTEEKIDSVWINDITQNRERLSMVYSDTMRFKFKDSINDLYNIWFWRNGEIVSSPNPDSQLWLKGDKIQIKGKIEKKLIVDTLLNSPMYYSSKDFRQEYRELFKNETSAGEKNKFIIQQIKDNKNGALSLEMAGYYYRLNENNPENLRILNQILLQQNVTLRNHPTFNVFEQVNTKLNDYPIDLSKYSFLDVENKPIELNLDASDKYLIDAWFVACPPCVTDHKIMAEELELLESKGVKVIGISIDQEYDVWKEYLVKNKYNWQNYRVNPDKPRDELDKDLRLGAYPNYFLLNGNRNILISTNSYDEIKEYLKINS